MKATLLAGCVVLSVSCAAPGAHAYPARYYDCGRAFVKIQTFAGSAPSRRVFPSRWTISEKANAKKYPDDLDDHALNFRCAKPSLDAQSERDKCWLNGKLCRKISDEEGAKGVSDED